MSSTSSPAPRSPTPPWPSHELEGGWPMPLQAPPEPTATVRGSAPPGAPLADLSRERLAEVSRREGCDAATSLLYRAVLADPLHGAFVRRIDELARDRSDRRPMRGRVLVAPAAL